MRTKAPVLPKATFLSEESPRCNKCTALLRAGRFCWWCGKEQRSNENEVSSVESIRPKMDRSNVQ